MSEEKGLNESQSKKKTEKEQVSQLNQLKFLLTEAQKQAILQKHERVQVSLIKIGVAKNKTGLENYSKYKSLNDYDKFTLVADNYWHVMNGNHNRYVNVPINDLRFWFYFNESCFERCGSFQRLKKIENEELAKAQKEYQDEKIDFEIKDNVEPVKKIIEKETEPIIIKEEVDKIEIPLIKQSPIIPEEKVVKNKKQNKSEGQESLF